MIKYKIWETEVNEYMLRKHDVGVDDIPDMDYRTWYESGATPKQAVRKAIYIVNEGLWT